MSEGILLNINNTPENPKFELAKRFLNEQFTGYLLSVIAEANGLTKPTEQRLMHDQLLANFMVHMQEMSTVDEEIKKEMIDLGLIQEEK